MQMHLYPDIPPEYATFEFWTLNRPIDPLRGRTGLIFPGTANHRA